MTTVHVEHQADPDAIAGWSELSARGTYYLTPDWLRYVDSDGLSRTTYWGAYVNGRLTAAFSSHLRTSESNRAYLFSAAAPPAAPATEQELPLLLGGRRGYLSGLLMDDSVGSEALHDAVAQLLRGCTSASGPTWWWPYLTAEDAEIVLRASQRLPRTIRPGIRLVRADCLIDLPGNSIDDYVESLDSRQRRLNLRREARFFERSGLRLVELPLASHWHELAPLLTNVQRKYGDNRPAAVHAAFFERQARFLAGNAVLFGCYRDQQLVAFSLCYRSAGELSLRAVGFDYEALPGAGEYAQLAIHAPLRYCYEHGLRRLHLGTGTYDAKTRRGARIRPLWALVPGGSAPRAGFDVADARTGELSSRDRSAFETAVSDEGRRLAALLTG